MTRLVHDLERIYLTEETLKLAYRFLITEEFPRDIVELAIEDAIMVGQVQGHHVDARYFMSIIERAVDSDIVASALISSFSSGTKGHHFVH
ncbi:MAG TPA: hypothetical protein DEP01_07210 [Aminobacterium sp.]|uniref:hypothetical protein n=1 Tax=Aminobacterium TaxID=81466 RepID=UPI000466D549|nr:MULTISPECIES: hypothetical protein [Aminobacterium]HCA41272.1 hypothetical protein [Aminobacterium sp.]